MTPIRSRRRSGPKRRVHILSLVTVGALLVATPRDSRSQEPVTPEVNKTVVQPEQASSSLRLATWNIRWFPRGCADAASCPAAATDLELVTRTIVEHRLDLVALQEVIYDDDGKSAMSRLIASLDSLTSGKWNVDLQACGAPESQRVGFLWDETKVSLSEFTDLEQLNGASEDGGGACATNLRPGRYAYARSTTGDTNFHVITVHFDSGRRDRDYQNRRDATRQIPSLQLGDKDLRELDADIIVMGDFNTMGRGEPTEITAATEFDIFDSEIGYGFRRLPVVPACSQYYRGRAGVLDFFVLSESLASPSMVSRVGGFCAHTQCGDLNEDDMPDAYERLSDHCPVILELGVASL